MDLVEIFNESKNISTLKDFLEKYRVNLYLKDDKTIGGVDTYLSNVENIFNINIEFFKTKTIQYSQYLSSSEEYKIYLKNNKIIKQYEIIKNFTSITQVNQLLDIYIFSPSTISIPYNLLSANIIQTQGNFQIKNIDIRSFLDEELNKIKVKVEKTLLSDNNSNNNATKKVQKISAYLWSKSYNNDPNGTLLNITPFLTNFNSSSNMSGLNFSFSLPPITANFNKNTFIWEIKNIEFSKEDGSYISKNFTKKKQFGQSDEDNTSNVKSKKLKTIEVGGKKQESDTYTKSENYFFEKVISNNDVLFVCFDEEQITGREYSLEMPFSKLKGRNFDIIGLIDNCSSQETFATGAGGVVVNINASGRDLMKLLIDDNTIFYANSYNNDNNSNIFFNYQDLINEKSFLRNEAVGYILDLADQREYTIPYLLNFLISRISNIQVCPDELFRHLDDKSYFYKITRELDESNNKVKELGVVKTLTSGIWQPTKMILDEYSKTKRVFDPNMMAYQGSLMNYVNKVCQKPFVEFFGDTYNDKYLFFVRKPPFDLQNWEKLPQIILNPKFVLSQNLSMNTRDIYSWYNLKKSQSLYTQNKQTNFLTACFFPEYAEIWGAKAYEVTSQYLDDLYDIDSTQTKEKYLSLLEDFRYIIESNVYMPFTRTGTITVVGDSNYKKGIKLFSGATSEEFYIDAVSHRQTHNQRYEFVTTLSVSRGMVSRYIPKQDNDGISYFNLALFSEDFNKIGGIVDSKKSVKINRRAFDFFIQKRQFQ
jgi:hypothetical protein